MNYISTSSTSSRFSSTEAILTGLAPDGGLYIPEVIPALSSTLIENLASVDTTELLVELLHPFLADAVERQQLQTCIEATSAIPAPTRFLDESLAVLELFHGPTCAFKDFGATFMAQLFSLLHRGSSPLTVLAATSGDTGGAVAAGFFNVPNTRVVILFPKGKVSPLQELQLTTWGSNITAIEIDGSFDDCQALVKQIFRDRELATELYATSANSINIARLLPQMLYYAIATQEIKRQHPTKALYFSVPSGNLGNLSAGVLAMRCGIPIDGFHCAVNNNAAVAKYLNGTSYKTATSVRTVSNAMDVGNPSNFVRLFEFAGRSDDIIRSFIRGSQSTDTETLETMREIHSRYGYLCDPHTAIGFRGALQERERYPDAIHCTVATAHPGKFLEVVEMAQLPAPELPTQLSQLYSKEKKVIALKNSDDELKQFLRTSFCR